MIEFNEETRQFGVKSKLLGFFTPGAWHAKETAKYMYDNEDEYKKHRGKEAWKGFFTPISSMRRHERAKAMYEMGATPDQIKDALNKRHLRNSSIIAGALTGNSLLGHTILDAIEPNRKKFKQK